MKRSIVYVLIPLLLFSLRTVAQGTFPQPLPAQPPIINGNIVVPMVCGQPIVHRKVVTDDASADGHGSGGVNKAAPVNPIAYTQSIHNVVAKWQAGSVYRFDMGTTAGNDNIYQGHLLNTNEVHTGGHSFAELQAYAAAQGTTFNIGDQFYLNLYYTSSSTAPDLSFQLQFLWENLGNPANNVTINVETNYGINGAAPFTATQAAKMQAFYDLVNPIIKQVYGPPSRNHTITVVNDSYAVGKNTYYNGPNFVSSSYAVNADGDLDQPRLMIHEIIHGYRDNVCLSSNAQWHYDPFLSGFEEGFAEGVAIVVMDIFIGMYPNFFVGDAHKLHWNQEGGMPFEWDYDFQNHHQVTTEDFWSSDIATGSHWLRYGMGATAMKKMYYENSNVFKDFNAEYYSRMNADHTLLPSRALVVDIFSTIMTEVERTPITTWINDQRIFDCQKDIRKKIFMLTFTGLSWNSFQHDNRIIPVETHQNGLEWKWDSSDQAGTNEITTTTNSSWAWTHQLNNLTGDITFTRDWNNTDLITNRPIQSKNHWVNEAPTALYPAYIGVPLLGPHQGPNPYYVGSTFTRDHEQDNCTAVPGCGKRVWAMGNQPLYTTTSSAATVWPTLAMMGGTPLGDRAQLDLTESGLFQFKIGFNDPQGPRIEDTYYRLLGNAFIDIEGVFGGIYSTTADQVDGRMFIEHEGFGPEAQLNITSNYFKGTRLWASVPETDVNRQGGRSDRKYSVPGKVHAIYVNPDCSQKKIDFRTIGYGDGLDGTEMLLFNVDEFEDIVFTESNDTTICDGDDFNLAVTNNFPDIFAGDSRVTYSWKDPNNTVISTSENYTFVGAAATDAGTYTLDIGFFGCPIFQKTVEVTIGNPPVLSVVTPPTITVCEGDAAALTSNTIVGGTYLWTGPNGFTSSLQNPAIPSTVIADGGIYTVQVTAPACGGATVTASSTINLIVNSNPVIDAIVPLSSIDLCENNTLNLDVNAVTGATYEWTGPNSFASSLQSPAINNIQLNGSGIYQIVISAPGCGVLPVTDTATVTVTVQTNQAISVTVPSPTLTVCEGNPANLSATGTSGVTYLWTGPNSFSSTLQNPTIPITGLANAGVYTVQVSAVACGGAAITASETINLVVDANPVVDANVPNPVINLCENTTLSLDVNAVAGATYAWTGPNGFTSALQSPSISNIPVSGSGVYQIVVSVTGCGGTPVNDTATVTVTVQTDQAVAVSVPSSTLIVCEGTPIDLVANGTVGATYAWTGPNSYSSSVQSSTISSAILSNAGIYQVTASLVGCSGTTTATATIDVTVKTDPVITAVVPNSSITVCETEAINLDVNPEIGATYGWTGPNSYTSMLQSPVISNASVNNTGTYQVIVAVPGCVEGTFVSSTAIIDVVVTPTPTVNLMVTPAITLCPGDMIDLTANTISGASYSWSGPNGFTSTAEDTSFVSIGAQNNGNYIVMATIPGCIAGTTISGTATTTVTLNSIDGITMNIQGGQYICEGQTLQLEAISNGTPTSYQWIGPDGTVVSTSAILGVVNFSLTNVGMYYLVANYGCSTLNLTDSIEVFMQSENICHPKPHYYLPNVFSPNGDGENDVLYLYGDLIESMELVIYDRFGEIVFTSHLETHGWDGTYKGNLLNTAVFAYRLNITFTEGKDPVSESGNITLIR